MRVRRVSSEDGRSAFELLDDAGKPIQVVSGFLRHLQARGYCVGCQHGQRLGQHRICLRRLRITIEESRQVSLDGEARLDRVDWACR